MSSHLPHRPPRVRKVRLYQLVANGPHGRVLHEVYASSPRRAIARFVDGGFGHAIIAQSRIRASRTVYAIPESEL